MKKIFVTAGMGIMMLWGCASNTIKSLDEYSQVPMANAAIMPTETELEAKPYKVVVFEVNDQDVQLAKESDVGTTVSGRLVTNINEANATMVDSTGLSDLKQAIETKSSDYDANGVADYAVTGQISAANFSKEFTKTSAYKDKEGKVHVIPAYCTYSAVVRGNVNIYSVKTKEVVSNIGLSGNNSKKTEDPKVNRWSTCPPISQQEIVSIVRGAGNSAANGTKLQMQNFFAPKGYVLERRTNGKKSIFKVSLGQVNGAKKNLKAVFYNIEQGQNPITGKTTEAQNKIAEGEVTNRVDARQAWIMVDDEEVASQIKLGDMVNIKYEKRFLGLF